MAIEKTTKIGELLDANPEKAELLLSVGMHCLRALRYSAYGLLAQVVEHLTFNQVVPRSSRG